MKTKIFLFFYKVQERILKEKMHTMKFLFLNAYAKGEEESSQEHVLTFLFI